jgi:hypothetical protein
MKRSTWVVSGVLAVGLLGGGAGIALAAAGPSTDNGGDTSISGAALDKATKAALDYTGGGTVTGTEAGDEEGAYEVEVTKKDGSVVDVRLDKDFTVVKADADTEGQDGGK